MTDPASETPSQRGPTSALRITAQILGFLIGLALLVWCISTALKKENRESLSKLADASPAQIALLIGLSLIVMLASGAVFRQTLLPIKKLPMLEVQAVNAIACLLALLPFKLSVIFRVLVHNRRDGVPILTIGAWFGAVAAVILCVLIPILGAGIWRGGADVLWFITAAGGIIFCLTTLWLTARFFATPRGWSIAQNIYAKLPLPARLRVPGAGHCVHCNYNLNATPPELPCPECGRPRSPCTGASLLDRAHEGVRMLASPGVVYGCAGLRLFDIGAQAARIAVAAAIVGQPIHWEHALLAGSVFFLITAAAPSGALGAREGGTAWIISALLPGVDFDKFAIVVLAVSATEAIVLLLSSLAALAYLRPDRIMQRRSQAEAAADQRG